MLQENTLFGMVDNVQMAIDRIKTFCTGKRVLCAFSGGKDSQCCYHLLEQSGVEFHAEYSITRFEPPELIKFIRENYPDVTFRRVYKMPLVKEIEYRGLPNRWARWCCEAKHKKTDGYDIAVIGIRSEESANRKNNWRMFGFKQDKTAYLCPIIDWSTDDVWSYLSDKPHCCLYDQGYNRIGCVCCPLSPGTMIRDAQRYPKTMAMLKHGSCLFVQKMRSMGWITHAGKTCADWHLAVLPEAEYWNRWINSGQTQKPLNEVTIDDRQGCLFDGSGYSEKDGIEDED